MTGEQDGPVVLAVDFGTTNTVGVARWGHREPSRVAVDGTPSMPSAVLLGHDGTLIIGQDAVRLGQAAAARLEPRPKSRLDEETILLGDRTVTVLEVVRAVLARLCGEVRAAAEAPVEHLVLTHPADWGAVRLGRFTRAATGLAARISLVPEPVAAAAHAGRAPGGTRAVLDFGGGTCDAAVVRADPALGYAVLACAGLPDLGGDDLDQRVVDLVLGRSPSVAGRLGAAVSTPDLRVLRDRLLLRQDARAAKELLSRHDLARVAVPGLDEPVVVDRADFDRIVAADLERAVTLLDGVLRDARAAVDEVVLVGGSSRIPALGESLRGRLAVPVAIARDPESAVAFGALAVTGATERTAAHPVVLAPSAPPALKDPFGTSNVLKGSFRAWAGRRRVPAAALAVALVAVLVWYASRSADVTGSPVGSGRTGTPHGTPVTGPSAPPPRTVPSGQPGRFDTQQLGIEVRVDRIAVTTAAPAPAGYRWVRAEVTVTLREGYHDLTDATPMRLVDDRGQRILPARGGPAVRAAGCAAPLPTVAVGGSRTECQLFLVPNATPVAGVMYDDFSGTEVNRGGFVAAAALPAAGPTDLPGVVGRVGDPAREVDLGHGRFSMAVTDVLEAPSEYLTEDSRPMNGGRYVVVRMTVEPSGDAEFRDEDATFVRLLDDRGLPVPEEHLTAAELVDCPAGHRVRPGESGTACLVFTIGTRTPVAGVAYVGPADYDVTNWRTWVLNH